MDEPEWESLREVRIVVRGTVQGVGFRPFVHRTATRLGLDGTVRNVNGHVVIIAAGAPPALSRLVTALHTQAPPAAVVGTVEIDRTPKNTATGAGFTIGPSTTDRRQSSVREIPPDTATCDACLRELFDPDDRRFRHPFINCTDCGPRATVIEALPYDRARTTMSGFALCAACTREYNDPSDRRHHAEPLACPRCGPRLIWNTLRDESALQAAEGLVSVGGILALKGLGGYQLVCDATRSATVGELRRRKHRPHKPLAVMVADLPAARRLAHVGRAAARELTAPDRPVVLLPARAGSPVPAEAVHPGTGHIGVFLPTGGLHHLLLRDLARPLIVTSGNVSGEPLAIDDVDAHERLAGIADGFLTHDRGIRSRYDDSVVQVVGGSRVTLRRARGLAPAPLPLPQPATAPLVAVGAQSKHTFTLADGRQAVLGPHTGDLHDAGALEAFEDAYACLTRLTGLTPRAVAHDLHPRYLSTQWATRFPARHRVPVQHHHAHIAACAAEHHLRGPFLGVAYDGLGLGDDGTLWGGEILLADYTRFRRIGRFATAPLPGGESAVRHPDRMALGYLYGAEALGASAPPPEATAAFTGRFDTRTHATLRTMVRRGINSPRASSAGRLFDAAAALLGVCDEVSYEGQAAVALEAAAEGRTAPALPWRLVHVDGLWVYDPTPTLTALLASSGPRDTARLAAAFHATIAEVTAALVEKAIDAGAPRTVCLGGGCFANRRLVTDVRRLLQALDVQVYAGSAVPPGDGGISYGQAAVAAALLSKGT
ncbi:carbamoyltransferase HypF [Streptomyces purpurogeneiscleroticus]|uniref:carbamoyltransferase HypF n=1 Tax=Streptomyces purpurogeneiscleroticus TaxID=68259 RepID=UPI001CC125C1|nr:carbamoyltransferase HypF [Streptomyces purpurogeneiscleroticus]MBZ4018750.1 carbamoyltransferase HypF [Streptomyces purpurogeneiscleroticus]